MGSGCAPRDVVRCWGVLSCMGWGWGWHSSEDDVVMLVAWGCKWHRGAGGTGLWVGQDWVAQGFRRSMSHWSCNLCSHPFCPSPRPPPLICTSPTCTQLQTQVALPSLGEPLGFSSGSPSQCHFCCSAVPPCPCLVQPWLLVSWGAGGGLWSQHPPSFRGCAIPCRGVDVLLGSQLSEQGPGPPPHGGGGHLPRRCP